MATVKRFLCGRRIAILVLAWPLLLTGPCLVTAQQSVINGFFDAVTPLLIERVAEELGVTPPATTVPTTDGTAGFQASAM